MAEKMVDKVVRIMKMPERIRNIAIAAHIDHGKCVAPETRILLADGSVLTAAQMHAIAEQKGKKAYQDANKVIYDIASSNIHVSSLNKSTGKLEKKKITHSWKIRGGRMNTITTRNGFSATTTPEHKYIVLGNFRFIEKPAYEINLGDRIICSRKTIAESAMDIKKEMLLRLAKDNFYIFLEKGFGETIKKKVLDAGLDRINQKIKSSLKPR